MNELTPGKSDLTPADAVSHQPLSTLTAREGKRTRRRFFEFFTANIRYSNTRRAYDWADADFCD